MYIKILLVLNLILISSLSALDKITIVKKTSAQSVKIQDCEEADYHWSWVDNKEGCRDDKNKLVSTKALKERMKLVKQRKSSLNEYTYAGIKMYSNINKLHLMLKNKGKLDEKGKYIINDFYTSYTGKINKNEVDFISLYQVGLRNTDKYELLSKKFNDKYIYQNKTNSKINPNEVKKQNKDRVARGSLYVYFIKEHQRIYMNAGDRIRLILREKVLVADKREYDINIIYETKELVELEYANKSNGLKKAEQSAQEIDAL